MGYDKLTNEANRADKENGVWGFGGAGWGRGAEEFGQKPRDIGRCYTVSCHSDMTYCHNSSTAENMTTENTGKAVRLLRQIQEFFFKRDNISIYAGCKMSPNWAQKT